MKRLVKTAAENKDMQEKLGVAVDGTSMSYSNIVAAIHVIQGEMDILGTTQAEADKTISGSFNSMKAAWGNMLTALVIGGDDFDRCLENLITSAKTFAKNIIPAVVNSLSGIGELIEEVAPLIEKELPTIVDQLLPPLIKAATSLVKGLIVALPNIVSAIAKELPGIFRSIWDGIKEVIGETPIIDKVEDFFGKLKEVFSVNGESLKKIVGVVLGLVAAFKLFKAVSSITSVFGGKGGGGGGNGIFGVFKSLAKQSPKDVLKGMANLAIILGGMVVLSAAFMAVAPHIAKLSDMKSILKVAAVVGILGVLGLALSKFAGIAGAIPVATVAKGLANMAIMIAGMSVLYIAIGYVSKLDFDFGGMLKMVAMLGILGLVGAALAVFAGIAGIIPIPLVLAGLANIALAIGGLTAIVVAYGALSKIPGIHEFISSGGELLAEIFNVIGKCFGAVIGGTLEGIAASLPAIGDSIASFANSIAPALATFSSVDSAGLQEFATAFGVFMLALAGEKILSFLTGGIDYEGLGQKLNTLATGLQGFFSTVSTMPDEGFAKATKLFDCLAGIKGLPKEGGVFQWFSGTVSYSSLTSGLQQLASEGMIACFNRIATIPEAAYTSMTALFNALAGVKELPKSGGVFQWFAGENSITAITSQLPQVATDIQTFYANLGGMVDFSVIPSLFNALAGVKELPKSGGLFQWFAGEKSITAISSQLPQVASDVQSFHENLGGMTDFSVISSLFNTLSSIEIDSDAADKGFLSLGTSDLEEMGTGLASFAENAAPFFSAVKTIDAKKISSLFKALGEGAELPSKLSGLDSEIGTVLNNIVTTSETKMGEIKKAIERGLLAVCTAFASAAPAMFSSGAQLMQGLNNGMRSMLPSLVATATAAALSIKRATDDALQIGSPSKLMFKSGKFAGIGEVNGLKSQIPAMKAASADFSMAAVPYKAYSPESSTTSYNTSESEFTSIAPVFNLTVTGTQDDRATARKIKRYVAEAIQETLESIERGSRSYREA